LVTIADLGMRLKVDEKIGGGNKKITYYIADSVM
jgi:hypothetical protein